MPTYIVSVVLEEAALTDDELEALFREIGDVIPSYASALLKVTAPVAAASDQAAAFRLIDEVQAALPHAVPLRLDQDLVSISDIAARTSRTRESVRLLVDGKRGPANFPSPIGVVGDAIRVWPWAVVVDWFRLQLHDDLGERGIPPETAALVDACLAGKVQRGATRRSVGQNLDAKSQ